jgi:transketolase
MRRQFKDTVLDLATRDSSLAVLFGDVSVYLFREFQERYPDRFYNLGICENTIISTAAGLSSQGFTPIAHTIAPFLTERCYEQIKVDLSYNRFAANIVTCGASFDYAWDGATHHCFTDLALMRMLPNMEVFQPGSRKEFDALFRQRYNSGNAKYFRLSDYPHAVDMDVEYGKGVVLKDAGAALTVMTAGPLLGNVLEACKDLPVNLAYFHTLKPIDHELVARFRNTRVLVVHDAFGLKEAVHEVPEMRVDFHGAGEKYSSCYGKVEDARRDCGLDVAGIAARVRAALQAA